MTTDTRRLAEIVLGLAMLEDDCPAPWRNPETREPAPHPDACGICHGTGKVARFPMLREVLGQGGFDHSLDCQEMGRCNTAYAALEGDCDGRGWLPVVTTDALQEAVWSADCVIIRWSPGHVVLLQGGYYGREVVGDGQTDGIALARALEAAQQEAAR